MTSVQENYTSVAKESLQNEDIHFFPRCSTPIFDTSRVLYLPQEKSVNKNGEYCEWKKSLEREKSSRNFKLRGPGNSLKSWSSINCSIISGHFEVKLTERINEENIARPAPVYHQMWLPISCPTHFWNPAMYNHNNNCHNQNPTWYEVPPQQQQQQFQSGQVFGSSGSGNAFLNILSNAHNNNNNNLQYGMQSHHHYHHHHHHGDYYTGKSQFMQYNMNYGVPVLTPQQMAMRLNNFYYHQYQYHYPTASSVAQFFTYSSETQRTTSYVNVPIHGGNLFPVMMTS